MARNDPYLSESFDVSDGDTAVFDGSDSETDTAIISGLAGNADAEVRLQAYDGSDWVTVAQLKDVDGDTTFTAPWHTQFNRVLVSSGERRIEVTNASDGSGDYAADGDER